MWERDDPPGTEFGIRLGLWNVLSEGGFMSAARERSEVARDAFHSRASDLARTLQAEVPRLASDAERFEARGLSRFAAEVRELRNRFLVVLEAANGVLE